MKDMFNQVYPFLVNILQTTENILLFESSTFTIQQMIEWILGNADANMDALMEILIQKLSHPNPKIQQATVSCISAFIEEGEDRMANYYDVIIQSICQCFGFYNVFLIHSLTHSHIHYLIHSFTISLTHSLSHS